MSLLIEFFNSSASFRSSQSYDITSRDSELRDQLANKQIEYDHSWVATGCQVCRRPKSLRYTGVNSCMCIHCIRFYYAERDAKANTICMNSSYCQVTWQDQVMCAFCRFAKASKLDVSSFRNTTQLVTDKDIEIRRLTGKVEEQQKVINQLKVLQNIN